MVPRVEGPLRGGEPGGKLECVIVGMAVGADPEGRRYLGLDVLARARLTAVPGTAPQTEEVSTTNTIPALSA